MYRFLNKRINQLEPQSVLTLLLALSFLQKFWLLTSAASRASSCSSRTRVFVHLSLHALVGLVRFLGCDLAAWGFWYRLTLHIRDERLNLLDVLV